MSDAQRLYIARKCGSGMGAGYILSSLLPLLILFLVTLLLTFALSFISSMASSIDRMIQLMGSGTVYALSDPSPYLPAEAESCAVRNGTGLIYAGEGESAIVIKGVSEDYFSGMRSAELEIRGSGEGMNPAVISSELAEELSLEAGDRFTLLSWEAEKGRARPYLCTVGRIFSSVYPQLDRYLVYVPSSMLSSREAYEILLPQDADTDSVRNELISHGIPAYTYRELYASLYGNVRSSIMILYVILAFVALLAAFFSSDAAQVYLSRDRKDIRELMMLGMGRRDIRGIYFLITLTAVAAAALAGAAAGLILSALSPMLLSAVSSSGSSLLDYYVTSFTLRIPFGAIALMILMMLSVSSLSILITLRRIKGTLN